jgi:HD superfamily phosphohydrolase
MHVTAMTLDALEKNLPGEVTDDDRLLYRMAALLHDIGHYPFSHTFERALKNYYAENNLIKPVGSGSDEAALGSEVWLHEKMGRQVLTHDAELAGLLDSVGVNPQELARIIERINPPKFTNLVSSDLDADRVDYLMRTAKHTGLPYGNVDLPYLLSQIMLDDEKRLCFTSKGMRAAEHLLLSRYFDYQQVSYHKTVAGLELVLNDAVEVLFRRGLLDCSSTRLQEMVTTGEWHTFDDAAVVARMRQALGLELDVGERLILESVLHRRPPKLIANRERIGGAETDEVFRQSLLAIAQAKNVEWESEFGCRIYLWKRVGASLTKIGSTVPVSALSEPDEESFDKVQQSVRILLKDGTSQPIQGYHRSLLSVLSDQGVFSLRIYALLGPGDAGKLEAITERVNRDLGGLWDDA